MKCQNKKHSRLLQGCASIAFASFVTCPSLASAQDSAGFGEPDSGAVNEIVVTATKRATKVQDVPDSIKVLDSVQLENANVENLRGFVQLTPNLIVRETFRRNETFLTMRGISSAQGALPPVAFVVDGIQVGSNDFINQDLLDIERIEILRGPQGALYGQGAIAGAINIVTKQPANELEAFVKASYGNANTMRVAGSVSAPLVQDHLFAKLSGYYKRSDGLIKNNAGTRVTPYDEGYVRGQLSYKDDRLSVYGFGSYTNGTSYCCIQDIVPKLQDGVVYPGFTSLTGAYTLLGVDDVNNPGRTSNVLGVSWDRFKSAGLKIDYDFDPFTLTLISGYNYARQHLYGDADFTAPGSGSTQLVQDIPYTTRVYNQELRLTSRSDGPFQWILGAFYQDKKDRQHVDVGLDPGSPLNNTPGNISTFVLQLDNVTRSKSYAFFGTTSYDLTDRFQISGALRYDNDQENAVNELVANSEKEAKFTQLQPKVQLSYKISPDVMVYSSYAVGFRSGGYSQNAKFDNELTKNYEFGMKSTVFDGAATINAAVFHIDYANQQVSFVQLQPVVLKQVVNIDSTTINGMELEVSARPTDELTLTAGVGVVDAVIKKISTNTLTAGLDLNTLVGKKSPLVSPLTFNAAVDYVTPLSGSLDLLLHADYRQEAGYYFDLSNSIRTDTHGLIAGKIALETGGWEFGIWGNNLTNSRYATNIGVTGTPYRVPNQPRSYGVEVSFKY